jgi:hypothetical protein
MRALLLPSALLFALSPLAIADTPGLTSFSGGELASSGSDQLYGWIFTANANLSVTALGVGDTNGAGGLFVSHDVGIFDETTEDLLGSTTIPAGVGPTLIGGFEYESVVPFILDAGDTYVIVMTMPAFNGDTQSILNTSVTTASQITYVTSAFDSGSTLAFPNSGNNGAFADGMFGPNFTFASGAPATPEPASFALFGSGLLALGLVVFYRRRAGNQNAF